MYVLEERSTIKRFIIYAIAIIVLGAGIFLAYTVFNSRDTQTNLTEQPAKVIYINEIMASNSKVIADKDGDFNDWIELYNPNNKAVDLTGYYLSDSENNPLKWQFPPKARIRANGYLLIWASGKDKGVRGGELHTNFKINSSGEPIILTAPDGKTVIDYLSPTAIRQNLSYGRYPDGSENWVYFEYGDSTPGASNSMSSPYMLSPSYNPVFSHVGGFYNHDFHLKLDTEYDDVTIYYTLDGSEPTEESQIYKAPIHVRKEMIPATGEELMIQRTEPPPDIIPEPAFPLSMIRTGSRHWKSPAGDIFKATVVRARAYSKDGIPSSVITHTYFVDEYMPNRYTFPVLSVSTDMENLFGYYDGIHVPGVHYDPEIDEETGDNRTGNYYQRGIEWERPIYLEFFDVGGSLIFSQNAGVRIHGSLSRKYPVKSLRFYARNMYDVDNYFYHQFFEDKEIDAFKRIIFRAGGQAYRYTYMGEAAAQSLLKPLQMDIQFNAPAILFINGEYFGIRNIRDRLDTWHLQTHYGVDRNNVTILRGNGVVDDGDPVGADHYIKVRNFINRNDMSDNAYYDYVNTQIDISNFIDNYAVQIYFANIDWPQNNIKYWRLNTDRYEPEADYGHDGRWRWMVYDVDAGFGASWGGNVPDYNSFERLTGECFRTGQLWHALLNNERFKNEFINRFADHLNTIFKEEHVVKVVDEITELYAPEMAEHIDRWGYPESMASWRSRVRRMRNFANERPSYAREQLAEYFGLSGTAEISLKTDTTMGSIRINSVEINEETTGVDNPDFWSGIYFKDIPVTITAVPKPGFHFVRWETDVGNAINSDTYSITLTLEEDMVVSAVFEKNTLQAAIEAVDKLPEREDIQLYHKGSVASVRRIIMELIDEEGVTESEIENIDRLIEAEAAIKELELIEADREMRKRMRAQVINNIVLLALIIALVFTIIIILKLLSICIKRIKLWRKNRGRKNKNSLENKKGM